MTYVDGFVLPVPENKIDAYMEMASGAGDIWMDHGALAYKECVMEDGNPVPEDASDGFSMVKFADIAGAKDAETVVFAFIIYKSRAHRDDVNARVMADPRMKDACPAANGEGDMPFDFTRMAYGGFKAIVDL